MKTLVLGNKGYIGPVLGEYIKDNTPSTYLVGVDTGWFNTDFTDATLFSDLNYDVQYHCDIRSADASIYSGVDAVVALAAVSNDPMGAAFKRATHSINHAAILKNAEYAKAAGVSKFIFASSCSVYGSGGNTAKTENDDVAPLTDYAVSKIQTEMDLKSLADDKFEVVCLRFATACGISSRTRLDLVLNDFVWSLLQTGCVEVLSDGSPLRPLIDVSDMSRAIHWALTTELHNKFEVLNCGYNTCNYSVAQLARAVAKDDMSKVKINTLAVPDKRSYKVDFTKFEKLSGFSEPVNSLDKTITELSKQFIDMISQSKADSMSFQNFKRHEKLKRFIVAGDLDEDLFWYN